MSEPFYSCVEKPRHESLKCLNWALSCSLAYFLFFFGYYNSKFLLLDFVILYASVSVLTAIWGYIGSKSSNCMLPLCAVMIFALGPFGALMSIIVALVSFVLPSAEADLQALLAMLYPETEEDTSRRLCHKLRHSRKTQQRGTLLPFRDVMAFGSPKQKQKAIENMARNYSREFAPALKAALIDPDNFVRVQAASAMQLLETNFQNQEVKLEKLLETEPGNKDRYLELAELYADRANSDLLDEETEKEMLLKSLEKYKSYCLTENDNERAVIGMSKLLSRLGRYEEACECLRNSKLNLHESSEALLLYIESLYRDRKFSELRELLRSCQIDKVRSLPVYELMKDSLGLWTDMCTISDYGERREDS